MKIQRKNIIVNLILLLSAIVFCGRMQYNIPNEDNYSGIYVNAENPSTMSEVMAYRITTVGDVFESVKNDYLNWNGRSIINFVMQSILSFVPHWLFMIMNTLVFILCIIFLSIITFEQGKRGSPFGLFMVTLLLLYLLPQPDSLWYCPVFGCNYMWTLVVTLMFLMLWEKVISGSIKFSGWNYIPVAIFCFVAGWMHEVYSVGVAGMLVLHYALRKFNIRKDDLVMVLPYLLGTLMMLISPGNFLRMESFSDEGLGLYERLFMRIYLLKSMRLSILLIFIFIYLAVKDYNGLRSKIKENVVLYEVWIVELVFVIVLNISGRAMICLELFSGLIIMRFLYDSLNLSLKNNRIVAMMGMILVCIHQFAIIGAQKVERERYDNILAGYVKSADGVVVDTVPDTRAWIVRKYVVRWSRDFCDNSNSMKWNSLALANYLGQGDKLLVLLNKADYELIHNPKAFEDIPADQFVQADGGEYLWTKQDVSDVQFGLRANGETRCVDKIKKNIFNIDVNCPTFKFQKLVMADGTTYYATKKVPGRCPERLSTK